MTEHSQQAPRPTEEQGIEQHAYQNGRGSAYPNPSDGMHAPESGLSKRELFAAMAMQGLLSHPTMPPDGWSKMAVFQADDLLKELAK
jgi:hypothetical protein